MVKRRKIGLFYNIDQGWDGGKYYIANLIKSLSSLPKDEIPEIYFICKNYDVYNEFKSIQGCSGIKYFKRGKLFRWRNCFFSFIEKISGKKLSLQKLDIIFPDTYKDLEKISRNTLFWIPDFQHVHYPEFFSKFEIENRIEKIQRIVSQKSSILLSSKSAENDFRSIYPVADCKISVLPFSVSVEDSLIIEKNKILKDYKLEERYFIIANQMWKHKNHFLAFNAIKKAIKIFPGMQLVCTGKEYEPRDTNYPLMLKQFVLENGLEKNIKLLGYIPRNDQISIIKHSLAVVQPSLFEGWNTSIEEAKALNKLVIASDIAVHKEQLLGYNGFLFKSNDCDELCTVLINIWSGSFKETDNDYKQNIRKFGRSFMEIVNGYK